MSEYQEFTGKSVEEALQERPRGVRGRATSATSTSRSSRRAAAACWAWVPSRPASSPRLARHSAAAPREGGRRFHPAARRRPRQRRHPRRHEAAVAARRPRRPRRSASRSGDAAPRAASPTPRSSAAQWRRAAADQRRVARLAEAARPPERSDELPSRPRWPRAARRADREDPATTSKPRPRPSRPAARSSRSSSTLMGYRARASRSPPGPARGSSSRRQRRREGGPRRAHRAQGRATLGAPAHRQPHALAAHGQWTRVLVDVEDYRGSPRTPARRGRDAARRTTSARPATMLQLEPMTALERRWVHLALRDVDGVATQSIGEEPQRRVVVMKV